MAFIQFEEIHALIDKASIRLADHSMIVRYINEVPSGDRAWRSIGFYARTNDDRRLVLEVLHHDAISSCLVRVFLESPLEMLFSFKVNSSASELEKLILRGVEAFLEALRGLNVIQSIDEDFEGLHFSPEEVESIKRALLPLPPPFKPELVPNA